MAIVEIDKHSGFCLGVVKAINKAEKYLSSSESLYSLGDIVHNDVEVDRLGKKGLLSIDNEEFSKLKDVTVLLRAHGEPPSTYQKAKEQGIKLIDATCPVVLSLQERIRKVYELHKDDGSQIVIFGKRGHAEVIGLVGQTENNAIVIQKVEEAENLDYTRNIYLYSQTTKSLDEFKQLVSYIKSKIDKSVKFEFKDSICRQVANRLPHLKEFVTQYDTVLFVSGTKSSNGRELFNSCRLVNEKTYFISSVEDFSLEMVKGAERIGICGATSTPLWLMEEVKNKVEQVLSDNI